MLKLSENGIKMYVYKVFDEMTKRTKVHVRSLWKCQCVWCI